MASRPLPRWLRHAARWLLADELAGHRAELAASRSIACETAEARDALRTELIVNLRFMAARGNPRCLQVPLYTDRHVAGWIERVRVFTGDYSPVDVYRCGTCPRHPIMGITRHVRPAVHVPVTDVPLSEMSTGQIPPVDVNADLNACINGPLPGEDRTPERLAVAIGGPPPRHSRDDDHDDHDGGDGS